jgi:hypothetical protein
MLYLLKHKDTACRVQIALTAKRFVFDPHGVFMIFPTNSDLPAHYYRVGFLMEIYFVPLCDVNLSET